MNTTEHKKFRLVMRSIIVGMMNVDERYAITLAAFDYAEKHHTGLRKDGVTPEFNHPLNIFGCMLTQIKNMKKPWLVLAVILLHDTLEDYGHLEDEMSKSFKKAFKYVNRISKVRRGEKLSNEEYYPPMALCAICSIAKPSDRLHNLTTMIGVMPIAKLEEAVIETEAYVLPLLKEAKKNFPKQTAIYELLKSLINIQLTTIRQYVELAKKHEKTQQPI